MHHQRPPLPFAATVPNHSPDDDNDDDSDYYKYHEKDADSRQHPSRAERASKSSSTGRGHDSVISHPFSPKHSSSPSPTSSISSTDGPRRADPGYHHAAPTHDAQNIAIPQQAHLDPEKQAYASSQAHPSHRHSGSAQAVNDIVYDKSEYHEKAPEEKAWQLLFYLSGPCALLSIAITFWSIAALFISLVLAPLKFCAPSRPSLSTQLANFLVPALNLQLHLVYSHNASHEYSAPMLVVIHLFSPVVALGVAIAAWTAAGFWFFSSILGDPGGQDGHNDGKESILGVRNWWERWLSRALR